MIVSVAVADVRAQPKPHIGGYVQDPDQETQVTFGEPVIVKEIADGWARVECPLQPEFTHNNLWEGYPGWVDATALSDRDVKELVLTPSARPEGEVRFEVLRQAARHLGNPYFWGGLSLHDRIEKRALSGVDCSGLVHWSFRQTGRVVPRDAHEQFMKAQKLEPRNLKPGDLIFLAAKSRPDRITHVAFYTGEEKILEAPQSGEAVREIFIQDRFGSKLSELSNGQAVGDRVIYFGTLFGIE